MLGSCRCQASSGLEPIFWVSSVEQVCVCVEPAGTFAVCLLLCPAVFMRRRLEYCAPQEFGGLVFCLLRHYTLVHFGLLSSINLTMFSSPACSRKKKEVGLLSSISLPEP